MPRTAPQWDRWAERARAQDRREAAIHLKIVSWSMLVALAVVALWWTRLSMYDNAIRFVFTACAVVLMAHNLRTRHFALAAAFAVLVLLYNPLVPVFRTSGNWPRALVVASAVPFAAAVAPRKSATLFLVP